jgi:Ni/Co efflux regulator RcnB
MYAARQTEAVFSWHKLRNGIAVCVMQRRPFLWRKQFAVFSHFNYCSQTTRPARFESEDRGEIMHKATRILMLSVLAVSLSGIPAIAQDQHDNHTYVAHNDWKKGGTIRQEDCNRGEKIDYTQYHLAKPADGHEWRLIDGQYVLCDANGKIFAVRRAH